MSHADLYWWIMLGSRNKNQRGKDVFKQNPDHPYNKHVIADVLAEVFSKIFMSIFERKYVWSQQKEATFQVTINRLLHGILYQLQNVIINK